MYVDNLVAQGSFAVAVDQAIDSVEQAFKSAGVVLHPAERASSQLTCLGVELDEVEKTARLTNRRYWKIWAAITVLLDVKKRSGRQLSIWLAISFSLVCFAGRFLAFF